MESGTNWNFEGGEKVERYWKRERANERMRDKNGDISSSCSIAYKCVNASIVPCLPLVVSIRNSFVFIYRVETVIYACVCVINARIFIHISFHHKENCKQYKQT